MAKMTISLSRVYYSELDINDEHSALSKTDKHGNLIHCQDIQSSI